MYGGEMTKVSLITKDSAGKLVEDSVLHIKTATTKTITLKSNTMLKLEIKPEDISSIAKEGNNAVIYLKDGTKVVLENFYIVDNPQIILQNGQQFWAAKLGQDTVSHTLVDYVELNNVPELLTASDSIPMWTWLVGGLAGATAVAVFAEKDSKDTTPPIQGTLSFSHFIDTGHLSTDSLSQDKTFNLVLTGQESNTTITYLMSKDNGQTWTETTVNQTDLVDGSYQFKAVVTDAAGNRSETAIQKVVIDTTAPTAGVLQLTDFTDTGISATDQISQDKSFTLALTGQESNTTITYLMSKDNGQTWTETTVNQADLVDGSYQFKAVVIDAAGNRSETEIQKVVIDTTAPVAGILQLADFTDTGISATDQISQDKSFTLALTGQESNTTITYLMSKDNGQTWTETTVNQTDLVDGTYQFKAIVTDAAGNRSETAIQKVVIDTTAPTAGVLQLTDFTDTGISATDQISQDKSFTLALTGQESNTTITYLISKDNGQTWTETTVNQTDLVDGSYQFKAVVTDAVGNRSETAIQKVMIDTTAPTAGVLQLTDFTDTGISATDQISQDKSFTLALTGQESNTTITYLISKDNGQTWTETTVNQTDLVDGNYQFKAIVTDAAGNRSETAIQKVVIDTTAPVAGILQLTDFTDTGISATDQISQDKSFTLQLAQPIMIGEQVAFLDHFEVSTDNGQTWNITDAEQTDLVDGTYQFKGVVTDAAGNHAETIIQQVTVDRELELLSDIFKIESVTEDNTISLSEKDQVIPIRIQIDHLPNDVNQTLTSVTTTVGGTIFNFTFDSIHQDWVVEIPATSLWSDQQHNSLAIDISFTDIAGNTATFQQIHNFQLNHIPVTPQILEAKSNNLDGSIISGTAYKGSVVDFYNKNGEWIASTVANEHGEFSLKTSLINADQEIYVTAKVDEYTSEVSLPIIVVEVPFLNIIKISPEGIITGYVTEGSHFSVRDAEGNLIQVFPSVAFDGSVITLFSPMNLGNVHPFTLVLDKPLTEGSEIIITAEKNGFIGHPQLIIADYTPAEFLEQPMFNEEGNHLLVHTNEPNTLILVFSKISENMIGFGYSDENGVAHVEISQTLNEGEQVRVQLLDKNQNMSEVIINAPNFAYAPNVYHISQDGLISGWVETNSTIIVKDANGIVLGEELSGEGFIWNHDFTEFNLLVNRSLTDGEQLFIHIVDAKGLVSPETVINVDFTPPPAPTHLYFNEKGDWIYGTAEAFTEITITDKNGTVLNHWGWDRWTDQNGNFSIELNHYLTNADIVYVTAKDSNGNISLVTEVTAPNYAFAPIIENLTNQGLFTGYAESNSTLIIKDAHNVIIAEITISNNNSGNDLSYFSFNLNKSLINGETFTLSIIDHNGLISAETIVIADVVAPELAKDVMFVEDGYSLVGTAELGSKIRVFDQNGTQVNWRTDVQSDGSFHIGLGNHYLHGEAFTVTVTDRAGNISQAILVNAPIDDIAPSPIEQIVLNTDGQRFTAQAESNSRIEVLDQSGRSVGWGSTDSQGNVSGYFNQIYLHGEELRFIAIDRAGNRSAEIKQTALIDNIAPNVIANIIFNENGQSFTGSAEAESRIEVFDSTGAQVGWGYVATSGNVSGTLYQTYLKGQELTFVVIDRAGNRSVDVKQTALNDDVAPNAITNIIFNENGQNFTAVAEAQGQVEVLNAAGYQVGWGYVDSSGNVSGTFYQTYLKGQELTFVVIDRAGNRSVDVKQTALNDDVAPNAITNIIFNENGQNFTAVAEAQGQVEVFDATGTKVGWGNTDSSGNVSGYLNQTYLKGQELTFVVIDRAGNRSVDVKQTALSDDIAPSSIKQIVLNEDGQRFTAQAEADSQIEVLDQLGSRVGWGYVDGVGNVSGYFNQIYLHGEQLTFVVVDRAGNRSVDVKQTALNDDVAPNTIANIIFNENGQSFTGLAEAESRIEVFDATGAQVGWGSTNSLGNVSGYLNQTYLKGQQLTFVVIDRAGNRSVDVKQTALSDDIAPSSIKQIVLNEDGQRFTAQAEADSQIEVLDQLGSRVGWGYVDGVGNVSGYFNQIYLHGEELRFIAIDRAGNRSTEVKQIALIDNIAPNPIENIIFNENGQNYTAKTEANATIEVKDKDGNLVGRSYSDNNGHVNGYLMQVFLKGETLTFIVIDSANNQSIPVTTHAFIDSTAPLAAQNVSIGPDGWISGYAEAYSIVEIMDQYGAVIATTQVDYAQKFNLLINLSQYQTQDLTLIIKDIAGNSSEAVHQVLPLITNSPAQVADLTIDVDGHQLTGIAKVGSYIIVTDMTGKRADLGWGMNKVVNSDGTFTIELDSYYLKGQTLQVRVFEQATDQYSQIVEIITPLDNTLPEEASQVAINELGYLIGHAESTATVEIIYHLMSQETHTNTVVVGTDGMFTFGIYENATSFDLTVIDRAGNRSETISQLITDLPKITVDQLKGDATNNIYTVDHISDFVQEYDVVVHEVYQDVWINTSHYEEQWVVTGYNGFIWIDTSHFEDVWIDTSYPQQVWIDTSFYQDVWVADGIRDVYTDSNGINYYSNDGSYEAYMNTYYDSKLSQWQLGYELFGPYAEDFGHNEQQLVNGGYFEYQMVPQGHYEQQYISEGYNKPLWVDTSHYENVWVESGYWENQLITSEYRDVDFGGHDKIISSVDYSLLGQYQWITDVTLQQLHLESGRYVEDLELVGFANLNATGNALDNHLTGNSGNNILDGRDGNDTYSSGDGSDKIIFHLLNATDVTGGNGQDTVLDFYLGDVKTNAQADQIDLSDLLVGYSGNASSVSNFINVKQENGSTIISIDRDGKETTFESAQLITLNQTNTTLADLLNNQQIVLFH